MGTHNIRGQFRTTDRPAVPVKFPRATLIELFVSLFAMVVIRYVVMFFAYEITFGWAILKETLIWLSAAGLLLIIRRRERLPLRSIGLGTAPWWNSIIWGVEIAVVLALVVGGWLFSLVGGTVPALLYPINFPSG